MKNTSAPKKLRPQFEQKNAVLYNAYKKPVTVNINEEVTIDLDYQGWPTVCRGDGDTLYAAASIRRGHVDPFGATVLYVSHDGGKSWSEPRIVNDTPADDRDTGIVYLGNGRLVISYFTIGTADFLEGGTYRPQMTWPGHATAEQVAAKEAQWADLPEDDEAHTSWNGYLIFSEDYGQTWSEPIRVPGCDPHGPTLGMDGTLWQARVRYDDGGCFLYRSADGGRTWETHKIIPLPLWCEGAYFSEPYILQLRDGRFIVGIRSADKNDGDNTLRTLISLSEDGETFTEPYLVDGTVGSPPHLLELSSGAVLLTYSYRGGGEGPRGVRAKISYDRGESWSEEMILSEAPEGTHPGEVGYPSSVELDDGTLITVYYQPDEGDRYPSLLYTRWRLLASEEA